MKKRNTILTAILSAVVCFALLPKAQAAPAPETPDPGAVGGSLNTADGDHALFNVTTGIGNAALGWFSLLSNTDGSFNTAVGAGTLLLNVGDQTTGDGLQNTAVGTAALLFNSTGSFNTAVGSTALELNTTGGGHTAVGTGALHNNNASGLFASNTAVGISALFTSTSGGANTAVGEGALIGVDTGGGNTAIGALTGFSYTADESGNICIGAGTTGSAGENNAIRIGDNLPSEGIDLLGQAAAANFVLIGTGMHSEGISISELIGFGTIQIGRGLNPAATSTFIGGIAGFAQPGGGTVEDVSIELNGASVNFQRLGHDSSSRRYKEDIKPMDKASEALFKLKPVTYRIKKEINPAQPTAFGLIAEDVAEACPDLVAYSNGQPESVHYKQVSVMMLNEFLKEHKKVEEQQANIAELKSTVGVLTAQLKEQAAQIQKVSAELEVGKPATKVALGNQ
jgi:Chaperone of endosialidase